MATILIVLVTVPAIHYGINADIINSLKKIEVSGQVLTGLGLISQEKSDKYRDLLYYAGNIDVRFPASETETFYATIRIQPNQKKAGSLGLTNPKLDLPDFKIGYSADYQRHFSFGSIDVPFGQHMETLSDNANTFKSAFITNSLLYDAIAGPVGIPKIIGVHALFTYPLETYKLAIANSSKANQNSENGNFTLVFSAHTKRLLEHLTIGAAVMKADEFRDVDDGIDIGLLGIIADVDYKLGWGGIKGYIASINYDDTIGDTEGNSLAWMLETYINTDTYRYGRRPYHNGSHATMMEAEVTLHYQQSVLAASKMETY